MTAISSGFNYATETASGYAFNVCTTINTIEFPEYPLPPFPFGQRVEGRDNSTWVYIKPTSAYAVGTVGYIDSNWNFTAITTANSASVQGASTAVMSQVASVTTTPTSFLYDAVWVQLNGLCPAVSVAASTNAFSTLYTTTTPGQLSSTSSGGALAINSIVTTTTSVGAGTEPGILA